MNVRALIAFPLIGLCWLAFADETARTGLEITVTPISDRLIVLAFEDAPSTNNVVAFRSERGVVVVDTSTSPTLARLFRTRIEQAFPGSVIRYVVNSHSHGDHTWGNQVFADALIIGHQACREAMADDQQEAEQNAQRYRAYTSRLRERLATIEPESEAARASARTVLFFETVVTGFDEFVPTPPAVTFNDRLDLDLGDLTLHLSSFPAAHSGSDILIACPEERVLLTGDLFAPHMDPPYVRSDNAALFDDWAARLEAAIQVAAGPVHVLAGHGTPLPPAELSRIVAYLETQAAAVRGRQPAFPAFETAYEEHGSTAALAVLKEMAEQRDTYYVLEADLVTRGYELLGEEKAAEAVALFALATELYPESWNAFDSLGEAQAAAGDASGARASYRRSLELNPENTNAERVLSRLGGE